jgi:hypothetical protein
MFVVALAAAIIYPSIVAKDHIGRDARLVASVLRYVYDTALATKEPCTLKVDLQSRVLTQICPKEQRSHEIPTLYKIETSTTGPTKEGKIYIHFKPSMQDNIKVYLSEGDKAVVVQFNALSGRVLVGSNQAEIPNGL